MQRVLANLCTLPKAHYSGVDYEDFVRVMIANHLHGLEQCSATDVVTEYITSYQCKGSSNSQQWDSTLKELGQAFVNSPGGAE